MLFNGIKLKSDLTRHESEKRLGCITQESEYIKTWVESSGRKLASVLCKDLSLLRRIRIRC